MVSVRGRKEKMNENMFFGCGRNPNTLGEIVDGSKKRHVEIGNLLYGDIMLGNLTQIEFYNHSDVPPLDELYKKYKEKIPNLENLYFVEESAFYGTIYACGHLDTGVWTVYAKTSGYA